MLVKTDGLLVLRDLGSTNGTRVNGTRVRRAALLPHDNVSFANFHFKIHLGPEDAPIAPAENTLAMEFGELPESGHRRFGSKLACQAEARRGAAQ